MRAGAASRMGGGGGFGAVSLRSSAKIELSVAQMLQPNLLLLKDKSWVVDKVEVLSGARWQMFPLHWLHCASLSPPAFKIQIDDETDFDKSSATVIMESEP
jgi:hypothetical protein